MLSLTPRSKRRKLESLAVSSVIPRDLAMVKLEHIRAIYQHEQSALVEVIRSHRPTTELYKETLRILSGDQECSRSNIHASISGRGHISQPDQRLDQSLDSSRYISEAMLLPPERPAQSSTELVATPPNLKRARAQQTPSPLPFFNMDTVTGEADSDLTNPTLDSSRPLLAEPAQVRCGRTFTSSSTSSVAEGVSSESQQTIFDASTEPAPQISNHPRESARRLKRPASKVRASDLSIISEQVEYIIHDIADAIMSEPPGLVSSLDVPLPAPRQSIDPQDLIVGNQKPRPNPTTPRTPKRQLMTSPYRRQEASSAAKVSPSAATRSERYVRELAKAKALSKKLVAMFRNKSTVSKASASSESSLAAKSEDTTATAELGLDSHANEKPSSTETDSITSTMATPPTNTKTAAALGKSATLSPSHIPCAIKQQRRSGSTRSLASHRSGIHPDKLKSLTAGQLLRRMNKTLLGSSRLPVLPRAIVQKGVSSNVHLAPLRSAAKGLSSTVSAVAIERSTSASAPNVASPSSEAPPLSTAATGTIAEVAENQEILPPVTAVTKAKTTTKPSAAVAVKTRRVTKSVLSNKFRRVTRSTAAAASQMLVLASPEHRTRQYLGITGTALSSLHEPPSGAIGHNSVKRSLKSVRALEKIALTTNCYETATYGSSRENSPPRSTTLSPFHLKIQIISRAPNKISPIVTTPAATEMTSNGTRQCERERVKVKKRSDHFIISFKNLPHRTRWCQCRGGREEPFSSDLMPMLEFELEPEIESEVETELGTEESGGQGGTRGRVAERWIMDAVVIPIPKWFRYYKRR
ncbi:hypothetical protein BGX30_007790 [Mortierella sp. GBA39]|nr:hypothetical protein BGX30_007790 [Mortierella sp. GBA39]